MKAALMRTRVLAQGTIFQEFRFWKIPRHKPHTYERGTLLANRWKLEHKLGKGGYGTVYRAVDTQDQHFAVKMESGNKLGSSLDRERRVYAVLQARPNRQSNGHAGIPILHCSGTFRRNRFLLMDCLGHSLEAYLFALGGRMSRQNVLAIAIQALERIEFIHSRGIVHCDIKPSNLMMGRRDPEKLYIIDFGLSRAYRDMKTGQHIKPRILSTVHGTLTYMSRRSMWGHVPSRRDDMESLVYTLAVLRTGYLPWTRGKAARTASEVGNMKSRLDPMTLSDGMGQGMQEFIGGVWALGFKDKPKYRRWWDALHEDLIKEHRGMSNLSWT